jgi:hypothetical protein
MNDKLELLNKLPYEVIKNVMNDLLDYDETHVIFEDGKYNVSPSVMVCSKYSPDHKWIGTFEAKNIFPDLAERDALRVARDTVNHRISEIVYGQEKGTRPYPMTMLEAITDVKNVRGY